MRVVACTSSELSAWGPCESRLRGPPPPRPQPIVSRPARARVRADKSPPSVPHLQTSRRARPEALLLQIRGSAGVSCLMNSGRRNWRVSRSLVLQLLACFSGLCAQPGPDLTDGDARRVCSLEVVGRGQSGHLLPAMARREIWVGAGQRRDPVSPVACLARWIPVFAGSMTRVLREVMKTYEAIESSSSGQNNITVVSWPYRSYRAVRLSGEVFAAEPATAVG